MGNYFSSKDTFIDIDLLSLRQINTLMKRKLFIILFTAIFATVSAQQSQGTFSGYLTNEEYDVYLRIDFQNQNVTIPGQEIYGELPGYLGKKHNSFCWPITSVKKKGSREMVMTMVNDFGSEDLTATLTLQNDSTYLMKQTSGSTLKVPKNGKWQKLPKTLVFKRGH